MNHNNRILKKVREYEAQKEKSSGKKACQSEQAYYILDDIYYRPYSCSCWNCSCPSIELMNCAEQMELANLGKILLVIGGIIVLAGLVLLVFGKIGFIGKFPGDILIQKGNFTFCFPLVTFLILSIILTIVVGIVIRLFK